MMSTIKNDNTQVFSLRFCNPSQLNEWNLIIRFAKENLSYYMELDGSL
jgi:hypothetical protein